MSLLKEPINRSVYDFIIKSPHVESLFDRYVLYIVISLREQTLSPHYFTCCFQFWYIYCTLALDNYCLVLPVNVVVLLG